jgi:hypothetical protein
MAQGTTGQVALVLGLVEAGAVLPLRGCCLHRFMTAWTATAVASSLSPQTPVWKRGSERNAGTPPSCGWFTSWYVSSARRPLSPWIQIFLSSAEVLVASFRNDLTLGF